MLRSFTRPSTHLPPHLSSIRKENLELKFLKNSSLLLPTITPRPLFKLFCRRTSFNDTAAGTSRSESEFENVASYEVESGQSSAGIGSPNLFRPLVMPRMNLGDQAFFLLAFIACTTSVAFTGLVIAAVPTLFALKRAAISLAKLADTAREELPSTMAAIRLSGLEISDLTLEINELSGEIADGVNKSAQAVQLAEARIRQLGAFARQRTISMIQERANLPEISIRPIVARAARNTSDAVSRAVKKISNLFSSSDAVSQAEPKACENKSGPLNEEIDV